MAAWTDREPGPECFCGMPTFVIVHADGLVSLMCFFHTKEAGVTFSLPRERPDKWPDLENDEIVALITQGTSEHDAVEEES